jgi:regulator of nucleoside diphosphate kinase
MNRQIIITDTDRKKLSAIIGDGKGPVRERAGLKALQSELDRARVLPPMEVPGDVITMYSRAVLRDLDTGEDMEFTLVFPHEADIDEGKISVLAPLGTAMLGYRVGDEFAWEVPGGNRRLKVADVVFQPEGRVGMPA